MWKFQVIHVWMLLLAPVLCKPIADENSPHKKIVKRQLFNAFRVGPRFYNVFNSPNPHDDLATKFLGRHRPVYIRTRKPHFTGHYHDWSYFFTDGALHKETINHKKKGGYQENITEPPVTSTTTKNTSDDTKANNLLIPDEAIQPQVDLTLTTEPSAASTSSNKVEETDRIAISVPTQSSDTFTSLENESEDTALEETTKLQSGTVTTDEFKSLDNSLDGTKTSFGPQTEKTVYGLGFSTTPKFLESILDATKSLFEEKTLQPTVTTTTESSNVAKFWENFLDGTKNSSALPEATTESAKLFVSKVNNSTGEDKSPVKSSSVANVTNLLLENSQGVREEFVSPVRNANTTGRKNPNHTSSESANQTKSFLYLLDTIDKLSRRQVITQKPLQASTLKPFTTAELLEYFSKPSHTPKPHSKTPNNSKATRRRTQSRRKKTQRTPTPWSGILLNKLVNYYTQNATKHRSHNQTKTQSTNVKTPDLASVLDALTKKLVTYWMLATSTKKIVAANRPVSLKRIETGGNVTQEDREKRPWTTPKSDQTTVLYTSSGNSTPLKGVGVEGTTPGKEPDEEPTSTEEIKKTQSTTTEETAIEDNSYRPAPFTSQDAEQRTTEVTAVTSANTREETIWNNQSRGEGQGTDQVQEELQVSTKQPGTMENLSIEENRSELPATTERDRQETTEEPDDAQATSNLDNDQEEEATEFVVTLRTTTSEVYKNVNDLVATTQDRYEGRGTTEGIDPAMATTEVVSTLLPSITEFHSKGTTREEMEETFEGQSTTQEVDFVQTSTEGDENRSTVLERNNGTDGRQGTTEEIEVLQATTSEFPLSLNATETGENHPGQETSTEGTGNEAENNPELQTTSESTGRTPEISEGFTERFDHSKLDDNNEETSTESDVNLTTFLEVTGNEGDDGTTEGMESFQTTTEFLLSSTMQEGSDAEFATYRHIPTPDPE